ncbi:MAG TPA: glutaredoxin family protein [Burkholderiales bacterium]|nr:glutaredoxin family protein [Burkholderiales bacterium]
MILRGFLPILGLAALFASTSAQAQMQYRWIDKDGRVQYTDTPPPAWAKDVRKEAAPSDNGGLAPQVSYDLEKAKKDFPVTLYSSPNCKEGCDAVRAALNKRGVPFTEKQVYDVASNDELKRVSGAQEVPTLLVGRSVQRGFEQEAFDALLDSAGYPKAGVLKPLAQKAPPTPEGYTPPPDAAKPAAAPAPPSPAKGGRYDTSNLPATPSKPGKYGIPGESN